MLGLIVLFIGELTFGLAANADECSFGETYWCSSLENAKTCGALEHCKETVWQKVIIKQDETDVCAFCEGVIKDVEKFVKQNETEQKIAVFLTNACYMSPSKRTVDECKSLVQNYVPEIIDLVKNVVSSRVICSLLKLCVGLEEKISHSQLPISPVQPQLITKLAPLPIQVEPICTDCEKFLTDIKDMYLTNATAEQIESFLDRTVCALLDKYELMCKKLVKQYLPQIVQYLTTQFNPNAICQLLGFCSKTSLEARTFLLQLLLKKSDFYPFISAKNSDEGCNICKAITTNVQGLDWNKAVQIEIKDLLKKEICERFKKHKTACNGLIDVYGEALFELLANKMDPESRCRSLGFCAADKTIPQDSVREDVPSSEPASIPVTRVSSDPQCVICEFLMTEADTLLKGNQTKDKIAGLLVKACKVLPPTITDVCVAFATQYGRMLIDLLVQKMDPIALCTNFGLCNSTERILATRVQGGFECTVCEKIVQYLKILVKKNATVVLVKYALDKSCHVLPSNMQSKCDVIVHNFRPFIIQFITSELTPKEVCKKVGLCSTAAKMALVSEAKIVKSTKKILGESECTLGPKYWCASKENAARCQTTDVCEQIGWNF